MARRKKISPFEDLIEVAALLPWWAGLGLALVSYLILHALATPPLVNGVKPGQIAEVASQALWKVFAYAGQIVVPLACLFGAVVSAVGRSRRSQLVSTVAQSRAADALHEMSWGEFEHLVGEAFRLQGYEVSENGGGGADGGVDLTLRKEDEKFLVQCKQWKAFKVGVQVIRELYGVIAAQGAAGGFVVTSGSFTDEASRFARGRNVKLIDGKSLFELIQQTRESLVRARTVVPARPTPSRGMPIDLPLCPECSRAMALKMAKRGPNAGNKFWSCTGFPACRGARTVQGI